jgi:glycosyltransferase involved in cell wall biosynthesis
VIKMLFEDIITECNGRMGILMPFRRTPWSGSFRVMVNFCKASKNKEKLLFVLFKGKKELKKYVEDVTEVETLFIENFSELKEFIRKRNIKILVGDDAIPRLNVLKKVKEATGVKTLVYVQFLYGLHKASPIFEKSSLASKLQDIFLTIYPWFLLTRKFKNILKYHDVLIANSKSTATLLWLLYGLPADEIVYPLVDTKIFRPKAKVNEDIVTIYSGSKAGDTSLRLLKRLANTLLDQGKMINIFGENIEVIKKSIGIHLKDNVRVYKDISDDELADIYSKSLFTIAPQAFELFGYVPLESMACGTPVLAFNYLGPSETILDNKTGWLANNEEDIVRKLKLIVARGVNKEMRVLSRNYVENKFSIESSRRFSPTRDV